MISVTCTVDFYETRSTGFAQPVEEYRFALSHRVAGQTG